MGCDIHLYFERKVSDKWQKIEIDKRILPRDRNYTLFAFLANVRNYGEFIVTPQFAGRGIPDDTSFPCKDGFPIETEEQWLGDHSFTYAYLDEILNAPWHIKEGDIVDCLSNCYFRTFHEQVLPKLVGTYGWIYDEEKRNIRVIMGFDN